MSGNGQELYLDALETPDVGFVAAAGVYVATVAVGATLTVAFALGASTATVVGTLTSLVTAGIVLGALASSRVTGLPERLGARRRRLVVLLLVPTAYVLVAAVSLLTPVVPRSTAVGGAIGAALTFVATAGIASMARTRYVRAVTPDDPLVTYPLVRSNLGRSWIVAGVGCLGVAAVLAHPAVETISVTEYATREPVWWFLLAGFFSLFVGVSGYSSARKATRDRDGDESFWHRFLPDASGRKVFGKRWGQAWGPDPADTWHTEARVHEAGLVVKQGAQRRLIPWSAVSDVHLTPEELVVERRRPFDLRCARSVIDDPKAVYATIERIRTDSSPVSRRREKTE